MPWTNAGGGLREDMTAGWLTSWTLGNWTFLIPTPVLGMCILLDFPILGSCLNYAALRYKCGVETFWRVYITKPSEGLYINFSKIWQAGAEVLLPQRQTLSVPLLIKIATRQSEVGCLFLWSLLVLCVWGQFAKQHLVSQAGEWRNESWKGGQSQTRISLGKSQIGHQTLCGEGWPVC